MSDWELGPSPVNWTTTKVEFAQEVLGEFPKTDLVWELLGVTYHLQVEGFDLLHCTGTGPMGEPGHPHGPTERRLSDKNAGLVQAAVVRHGLRLGYDGKRVRESIEKAGQLSFPELMREARILKRRIREEEGKCE
jgi:hypothetical protein